MPRPGPRMPFVGLRLPEQLIAEADAAAKAAGLDRSTLLRQLIRDGLRAGKAAAA